MMEAADLGKLYDWARCRRLDRPHVRRIFLEREMSSGSVIVREVAREDAE